MLRTAAPLVALTFLLAACGTTVSDRTLSGAGLVAAGGAVLGAVTGLGIVPGIVIGAAAGGVTGFFTDESKINLGTPLWRSRSGFAPRQANAPTVYDALVVSDIQAGLDSLGYRAGPVDGVMGPQTGAAIRRYQAHHALPVDGRPTRELARHVQAQAPAQAPEQAQVPAAEGG